jgi:GWxTD domain-containing protein
MKKSIIILFVLLLFLSDLSIAQSQKKRLSGRQRRKVYKSLRPQYQDWLNKIKYIAVDQELDTFYKLKNDRERNIFVKAFWLQRDPTPGTPHNEYKQEIDTRFAYVNKQFKRGSSKPGWMTDMGKFYMILGKPNQIDRFDSKPGLFPAQVWYYFGDKKLGLPTYFNITFFKPNNTTEWKFYNPATDGPASLLIQDSPVDVNDNLQLYTKIKELAPMLAMPAVTMVPNETGPDLMGLMRANLVISKIYESPKRRINTSYATNFLNYKGYVNIDSSTNYIANTHLVSIQRFDRLPFSFLNISLKPKKISVGFNDERNQYFYNFKVTVSLKQGERFIYEYSKNFEFYVDRSDVGSLEGRGVVIHDIFPVIPGKFKLMVFAHNQIGKEFVYFDEDITIPPYSKGSVAFITKPVVGHQVEDQPRNLFYPYKVKEQKLFVDTDKIFRIKHIPYVLIGAYNISKKVWEKGKVILSLDSTGGRRTFNETHEIFLKDFPYNTNINILQAVSKEGLNTDYYEITAKLINDTGITVDVKRDDFSIAPTRGVGHPFESFKRSRFENPYFFYYVLGMQYENMGNMKDSIYCFQRSITNNPEFLEAQIRYLMLLNRQKEFAKVLSEVEKLGGNEKFNFEYHLIKGTALFHKQDFENALQELIKANTIYDSDIRVLNLLGFTLLNLKEYEEALRAFNASLKLNKEQPAISDTIKKINQEEKKSN